MSPPVPAKSVLVAANDSTWRNLYTLELARRGLRVLAAEDAHGVMELAHDVSFDVAIVDLRFQNAADLIRQLSEEHPTLKLLAVRDHGDSGQLAELEARGVRFFDALRPIAELISMIQS